MRNGLIRKAKSLPLIKSVVRTGINPINKIYREKQVAVFHIGRCGSTVLGQMLNSHSNVFWGSELYNISFDRIDLSDKRKAIKKILDNNRNRRISKIYGFETRYLYGQHLSKDRLNIDLEKYIRLLDDIGFQHFIILHRKNLLRHAISFQIAKLKSQWHSNRQVSTPTKLKLKLKQSVHEKELAILDSFKLTENSYKELTRLLSNKHSIKLIYEDDIMSNPMIAYSKVCEFLKIKEEDPKIKLRRTNPFPIKEILINFEEVYSYFQGSGYEWMLQE